ncbi:MAG: hemolysin [Legionellales bacterium]|nr:hemolysin [Legionellales bacterium]|tara:strand:+ start:370 stop:1386 length:1017 start_codon:yes stop_codon:yes gene_type:complete
MLTTNLVLFFFVAIVFSFLCSLWEAVLLSITPSYMQAKYSEGKKIGKTLKAFKENIDRPLAAILTVNTIAHTVGAIGVGKEAAAIWGQSHPLITQVFVPILMTAAILILSEIIPKTIGANNWKFFAPFTVKSLSVLMIVLSPVILVCQMVTFVFNTGKNNNIFSRTDFLAMAEIGSQEGALSESEHAFIHNMLHFKQFKVQDVMCPRDKVISAENMMPAREFYEMKDQLHFSRIPLTESGAEGQVVGYVLKNEVFEHLLDEHKQRTLSDFKRQVEFVLPDCDIFTLFNLFIKKSQHIAIVINSERKMIGLITMEDVIETLLGKDIIDEADKKMVKSNK